MDFPLTDYMDEDACYCKLVELLHPDGLACLKCGQQQRLGVHNRHRATLLEYQCGECGGVFNAWTGIILQGTHRRPCQILLILHGVATGEPTAQMARELGCDRKHLLELRHRLQEHARRWHDRNPLDDAVVEADETYQNAGKKAFRTTTRRTRHDGVPTVAGSRHVREQPPADRRGGGAGVW